MKTFLAIAGVVLALAGCSKNDSSVTPPPSNMLGYWQEGHSQASLAAASANQPCSGFDTSTGKVSTGIFRLDANGQAFAADDVKDPGNPYEYIGTVNGAGVFTPTPAYKQELLGTTQLPAGYSVDLKATLKVSNADTLILSTQLVVTVNGQSQMLPSQDRTMIRLSDDQQKMITGKAVQCYLSNP